MTTAELTAAVKAAALELGFTKVAVTRAEPWGMGTDEPGGRFIDWLERGQHATMGWMENHRELRLDVTKLVPGARSVVCLATNYYYPDPAPTGPDDGQISRYARGTDYHRVLRKRLKALLKRMESLGGTGRGFVDSGPLLEKAFAERAGLGWQGKHGNIITREVGSWVFLSELVTDLELVPDPPATDHCGTCTRCLDACPTDAIVAPRQVDANRCISHWTIEFRGDVLPVLADRFDRWIFGCDICQDVCPWNRKRQTPADEPEFAPRPGTVGTDLKAWAGLAEDAFKARFERSPVERTRYPGFLRNVRAQLRTISGGADHAS